MTPAPDSYKQGDQATKQTRFDNIHMGTDKKVTAKDIPLTPGPGQYLRVDEQYSRTFHHGTKYTAAISSGLSTHGASIRSFAKMTGIGSSGMGGAHNEDIDDKEEGGRSPSHFFGNPTGHNKFYATMKHGFGSVQLQ